MAINSGQIGVELETLQGMTPEEKAALVGGEYVPERLREFERARSGREAMLRNQLLSAQQMAGQHTEARGNSTPAAIASIVSNALRTFGGMAQSHRKEQELAGEQAESARLHEELMKRAEGASGAGLATKQRGLAGALLNYGSGGYGI
jgi:hypothetical protein